MADFNLYFPIENELEGTKYENVAGDHGGCTRFGLTLEDIKEYNIDVDGSGYFDCNDVRLLTPSIAAKILKKLYWDYFHATEIPNQSLAEFIVDGGLTQGRVLIVKYLQNLLGVTIDGHFGPITLGKLISHINIDEGSGEFLFLYMERKRRYEKIIINDPSQKKFYEGWKNRLNAIKYSK